MTIEDDARTLGYAAGEAAGSWVIDGNTTENDARRAAASILSIKTPFLVLTCAFIVPAPTRLSCELFDSVNLQTRSHPNRLCRPGAKNDGGEGLPRPGTDSYTMRCVAAQPRWITAWGICHLSLLVRAVQHDDTA